MVAVRAIVNNLDKIYSVKEYFEFEKNSELRHEFYYGKLIEMPGEAKKANRIAKNILLKWNDVLERQGLEIFTHDVKAEVKLDHIFRYPDLVVAPESDDEDEYIIKQPIIIAEIASEDSWKRDSRTKLKEYTALPTLKYYLIVSQEEVFVQLCQRKGNDWTFTFFEEIDDVIVMPEFNLKIELSELYKKVKFGEHRSDI
jgi:Uma2 family endonuclease